MTQQTAERRFDSQQEEIAYLETREARLKFQLEEIEQEIEQKRRQHEVLHADLARVQRALLNARLCR